MHITNYEIKIVIFNIQETVVIKEKFVVENLNLKIDAGFIYLNELYKINIYTHNSSLF